MSLSSFDIFSISDEYIVNLFSENLKRAEGRAYYKKFCIPGIELNFRESGWENICKVIDNLFCKNRYYDQKKGCFVETGKVLLRTNKYDYTVHLDKERCLTVKKNSLVTPFSLPFDQFDAPAIHFGLNKLKIHIPNNFEYDLLKWICIGEKEKIHQTVSYPKENRFLSNASEKISRRFSNLFS
ncbi:MAG: hypothetical protein VX777_06570 [Chlamydiota bacterium]|nr:hypothetical protein [Chlamydiota bacterium]